MTRRANTQGFTLVELMLALAFVGFVMIFAVTTVIQVMSTYNKGLALKEINQSARAATEDMARIIRGASSIAINTSPLTDPSGNKARVCFGGVSYVWNFTNQTGNKYTDGGIVTFARVDDPGNAMCVKVSGNYPDVTRSKATELVSDRVWVHQLTVTPTVNGSFIDIFIQLSTFDDITSPSLVYDPTNLIPAQRVKCKGGNVGQFCAVANFSETVNARGGY